jgi:hypothetical protein
MSTLVIFPWLNLKQEISSADVVFVPYSKTEPCPPALAKVQSEINHILKSYYELKTKTQKTDGCVIACVQNKEEAWNIGENDFKKIKNATLCLYLAGISNNQYFNNYGSYCNFSCFQYFIQNFTSTSNIKDKGYVTYVVKTRGSIHQLMGYKHGDYIITKPLQCLNNLAINVDSSLLKALGFLHVDIELENRILASARYFSLSHTDDAYADPEAELVFLAASFEMLFGTENCRQLTDQFSEIFSNYSKIKISDEYNKRPNIFIEPEYPTQKDWFIHKAWIKELHNLRSALVHGEDLNKRTWGWNINEHLIAGSFIYPLVLKIFLNNHALYQLTQHDLSQCRTFDRILSIQDWYTKDSEGRSNCTKAFLDTISEYWNELE